MSIYIETTIHGSMDELWSKTQNPAQHEQWDLRFTDIDYLREDAPQRFVCDTYIGFGTRIRSRGERVATPTDISGRRTSSLKFWSDAPLSLIEEGRGYWQYTPTAHGIKFVTRYDYRPRFGGFGQWVDNAIVRFLMGWAMAWSVDRLRLWIETGQSPQRSLLYGVTEILLWIGLVVAWWAAAALANPTVQFWLLVATVGAVHLHMALSKYIPSSRRCTWTWRQSPPSRGNVMNPHKPL